jgi:hypothetical protein
MSRSVCSGQALILTLSTQHDDTQYDVLNCDTQHSKTWQVVSLSIEFSYCYAECRGAALDWLATGVGLLNTEVQPKWH